MLSVPITRVSKYGDLFTGAGNWIRTSDLLITNQLLYQLSYASRPFGAGNGARTRNLQLGRLSLYQLSYSRSQYQVFYVRRK
jgi:hypothetical protein